MEPGRAPVSFSRRLPLPPFQHPGLVAFLYEGAAGPPGEPGRVRPPFLPLDVRPAYPVVIPAMRAGDKVSTLVRGEVLALDTRKALYLRGRDHEYLLPGEGIGPLLCQGHRVALSVHVPRVSVHLVHKKIPDGHGTEPHGAVRSGEDEGAPR